MKKEALLAGCRVLDLTNEVGASCHLAEDLAFHWAQKIKTTNVDDQEIKENK
jgi:hypothetical protein